MVRPVNALVHLIRKSLIESAVNPCIIGLAAASKETIDGYHHDPERRNHSQIAGQFDSHGSDQGQGDHGTAESGSGRFAYRRCRRRVPGFSYSMSFENAPGVMDKVYTFDDLKVYVDATSAMYLNGCVVDFVETLEASGFKFENPNVKSTCGCGSSFNV